MAKSKWQAEQDRKEHRKELMDQTQHYLDDIDNALESGGKTETSDISTAQAKENPTKNLKRRPRRPHSPAMPKALSDELDRRETETEVK